MNVGHVKSSIRVACYVPESLASSSEPTHIPFALFRRVFACRQADSPTPGASEGSRHRKPVYQMFLRAESTDSTTSSVPATTSVSWTPRRLSYLGVSSFALSKTTCFGAGGSVVVGSRDRGSQPMTLEYHRRGSIGPSESATCEASTETRGHRFSIF